MRLFVDAQRGGGPEKRHPREEQLWQEALGLIATQSAGQRLKRFKTEVCD
jgi:hypothetical protein